MIIIDLFDIDFHIFTVIKFLFNLVVKDLNIGKQSQHLKARNPGNTSSSESLSYMNINLKGNKFTYIFKFYY